MELVGLVLFHFSI